MSVRWDPLLTAALARELDLKFAGARVRAISLEADRRHLILFFRESTLAFELHPKNGWVTLLPPVPPPSEALRLPARLRRVRALADESALVIDLVEKGGGPGVEIIVEWVGTRWNAMVVEGESRILRHILLTREESSRTLRVGSRYEMPTSTERRGVDGQLTKEEWDKILGMGEGSEGSSHPQTTPHEGEAIANRPRQGDHRGPTSPGGEAIGDGATAEVDPAKRIRNNLLRNVAWSSGVNLSALIPPDGWNRWQEMIAPANWGGWILPTPRGLQPYPVSVEGSAAEAASSLLEAFRIAREREEGDGTTQGILVPSHLLEAGETRLHRLRGRLHRLQKELEEAPDPAPLRLMGDLILARWNEIPSGVDRITLTDFEGAPLVVLLDPTLRPDQNAARYYGKAGRAERAITTLPERIRKAQEEVERWSGILEGVREGKFPIDRLEKALGRVDEGTHLSKGLQKGKAGSAKKGAKAGAPLPYRRYQSSGGLEIRVGRGSRQNDDLTFHHSTPNDIWLHAGQASGAHVVLSWDREGNPPKRDLKEAGILAALNSGARHSKTVAITWTRRKYVRKPRKSPPGSVAVERVQTIFVTPDPELPERLAVSEGGAPSEK